MSGPGADTRHHGEHGPRNSRDSRGRRNSRILLVSGLGERTRITEQFPVNMGQDMNKPMQNIDRRLIINIAASLEWRISRTQERLGDP